MLQTTRDSSFPSTRPNKKNDNNEVNTNKIIQIKFIRIIQLKTYLGNIIYLTSIAYQILKMMEVLSKVI